MANDPTDQTLDRDEQQDRPEPDWQPEGEAFVEVAPSPDDEADDDPDLADPQDERRDALDAARERGVRNRRKGMPRKAVPSELRADPELTTAYWAGFDAADAELRSSRASSPDAMSDADREAYRAGWQAHRDGLEKQAPASLGGWGSAWAAWMTGWTDAEATGTARS